jgi:hypothetical protein
MAHGVRSARRITRCIAVGSYRPTMRRYRQASCVGSHTRLDASPEIAGSAKAIAASTTSPKRSGKRSSSFCRRRQASVLLGLLAKVEIRQACLGGSRGSTHSMTSRACRSGVSARGKCSARLTSSAGLRPGVRSQRRSASQAMSLPSRWRSLMMSMSDRSGE